MKFKAGFTLIEMPTVIAMLSILAALLPPAVSRASSAAKTSRCLGHARQLLLAWMSYASENDGRLAINVDGMYGGFTNWVADNMKHPEDAADSHLLVDKQRSLLAAYIADARIYKCASDRNKGVRSVTMNCRLNPLRNAEEPRWVNEGRFTTFRKIDDVGNASRVFETIEEKFSSINDGYFAVDMSNTGEEAGRGNVSPYFLIDLPTAYHSGVAVLGFADGHAIRNRWRESSTLAAVRPNLYMEPSRDAQWIQAHCTYAR